MSISEKFTYNEVIENVHLQTLAGTDGSIFAYLAGRIDLDPNHVEMGAWEIIGFTNSGVHVMLAYDLVQPGTPLA